MKRISLFFCLLFLFSCDKSNQIKEEINQIPIDFSVLRFDLDFKNATAQDIPTLKANYPYMFPERFDDSVWVAKTKDTLQRQLFDAVAKEFPVFEEQKKELTQFFQHVKYYFPNEKIPTVITTTSDVDYKNQVFYTQDYLVIALDTYLGSQHEFYSVLQQYVSNTLDKKFMVVDVAKAFADTKVAKTNERTFLAALIYQGKKMYVEDVLVPFKTEAERMEYTPAQYQFAQENENMIWQYFISNELLYATNTKLLERFVYEAPFSKFYLPIDNETPGRLGVFIGAQIVRSYMQNNDVSLQQLLNTPAEEIFKNAHYKPKK